MFLKNCIFGEMAMRFMLRYTKGTSVFLSAFLLLRAKRLLSLKRAVSQNSPVRLSQVP